VSFTLPDASFMMHIVQASLMIVTSYCHLRSLYVIAHITGVSANMEYLQPSQTFVGKEKP
jgi:hypothetical protein